LNASAHLFLLTDAIANLPLAGGTVTLGPAFQQSGAITNLTIAGATLAGTNTVNGTFNWNNGTIAGPLMILSNGVMNIRGTTTLLLEGPLTNAGTVTWTNNGDLDVLNGSGVYFGSIENLPGALFDIQSDQTMFNNAGGPTSFHNVGTLQKSGRTGMTGISIAVTNSGIIAILHGNISFSGGFTPVGGTLQFGMSSPTGYGSMIISGNAQLAGTLGVVWLNGFVPAFGNAFTLLNYGSFTGAFTNLNLPSGALWQVSYGPTTFTLTVTNINKLVFTTQPSSGELPGQILSPIVVQVQDPSGNPVAINGLPIRVSTNTGSGNLSGTLTQNTDPTGQATFSDLSLDATGTKTLRATATGLTTGISAPFQIVPLIGMQFTGGGVLLQLNGTNSHGITTIDVSSNLLSSWLPIYTNAPTNGVIQFLDTAATNYPIRFYRIIEQ
jgi:hypothetical protein